MQSLILLITTLLVAACGMPDIRIKRKVAASEVLGTWSLDPKSSALAAGNSLDRCEADPTKPHTITFSADGTCRYRSVLQMPARYLDAYGEWEITPTADDPKGSEVDVSLEIDGDGTYMLSLDLREESGELIFWEFWGDPDSWRFLEYKRKAEQDAGGKRG